MKTKIKAFSLLETNLVLLICGVLIIGVVQYWKIVTYEYKLIQSTNKANYIKKSLEGYVARNGFLPYAAKKTDGIETNDCCIGYVPYKTLGINSNYLYDGFGKKFKFIVNKNLVLKYHLSKSKVILPIQLPVRYFYCFDSITWNRLYNFLDEYGEKVLVSYDLVKDTYNIYLYSNEKIIKLDSLECLPPFNKEMFRDSIYLDNAEIYKKKFVVYDLIAWALISEIKFKQDELNIKLNQDNIVFFQTRFNLAAQIKCNPNSNAVFFANKMPIKYLNKYLT